MLLLNLLDKHAAAEAEQKARRRAAVERTQRWYRTHREHVSAYNRTRHAANPGAHSKLSAAWARNNPEKALLKEARNRAKHRDFMFDLVPGDISIPAVCPVLGIQIQLRGRVGRQVAGSPSIDRIDSRKGYVRGNVRVISWRANRLKGDATVEELAAILRYMREALAHG